MKIAKIHISELHVVGKVVLLLGTPAKARELAVFDHELAALHPTDSLLGPQHETCFVLRLIRTAAGNHWVV